MLAHVTLFFADAVHLRTLPDRYGAPLVEFYHCPADSLLYVHWYGHLTASEVIRGAQEAARLSETHPYHLVLNNKREANGDWSEALPWLQYEWLPLAVAGGLRALAYVLSPNLEAQIVSRTFVEAVRPQLAVGLFTAEHEAVHWLREWE